MIVLAHACCQMGPKGWFCGRRDLPERRAGARTWPFLPGERPPQDREGLLAHVLSAPAAVGGRDGGSNWGCCEEAHPSSSSSARAAGASLALGSGRGEIAELWHFSCSPPSACSHGGPGRTFFQDAKEGRPPLYHPGPRHSTAKGKPGSSSCGSRGPLWCTEVSVMPILTSPAAALPSLPYSAVVRDRPFGDHLALHHTSSVEMLPSGPAAQKGCNIRTSLWLRWDLAAPRGPMCSGKPILVESQHVPSPNLQNWPNFLCASQARLSRRAFPIPCPRKELAPGGCVALQGTSDSSLFRKSLTVLQTNRLCVCFFARSIFNQLKSRLLLQPLHSLAVSVRQSQNELSSVLAAPAAEERHQFPPQVCTFPCNVPLGSATSLQLRCDAAEGKAVGCLTVEKYREHQHFALCAGAQICSCSQGRRKPLCSEK